ncbi:hypothetical protein EG329_012423 [Mollisiaceae sp. DMI_Dod_QoI]|nr:hypothetical protein EG329_012423 [Helotiales sp. DMI_Dod_QoI]
MLLTGLISRWLATSSLFSIPATESQPTLRLDANNEFHIAIFADLHYGEEEDGWGITQDVNSTRVMNNILNSEKPDFVILNGDLVTGENTFLTNSTKYLDVVVTPLVEHNVGWASTYGNHDSQYNLSREALYQEETKYIQSYTKHSPPEVSGITNYYLLIFPHEAKTTDIPIAVLWFFDSQGGAPFQAAVNTESIPDWVDLSIATWFLSEQATLKTKYGKDLPSLAFVHIPVTAFITVQDNLLPNAGEESAHFPGLNDDVPLAYEGTGWQDFPFMQALVDTPRLHSVYSGHDHGNAWCANWPSGVYDPKGVSAPHVCFCKHTGYGGYGSWNRGSRNLRLSFKENGEMEVDTWVRMENGEVVQSLFIFANGISTILSDLDLFSAQSPVENSEALIDRCLIATSLFLTENINITFAAKKTQLMQLLGSPQFSIYTDAQVEGRQC